MADEKVIAVMGATGAQGGGLVRAIAADLDGEFTARAITRDPSSDGANALAALPNVEVVQADLEDSASVAAAFAGAYGAFCVTFFWVDFSPETEMRHAVTMANAAKSAGVQRVVWSTLEDTRTFIPLDDGRMPTLQGKYKVPHFDGKEDADAAFADAGVPTTNLRTAFYWENLIYFGLGPARGEDGVLAITYPMGDSRLPGIGVEDIGKIALGVFKRGPEFIGKTIAVSGENLTGAQMAEKLSKALGEEVRYSASTPTSSGASASRVPTRSGTCSSSSGTSTRSTPAHATGRSPSRSIRNSRTSTPGSPHTPSRSHSVTEMAALDQPPAVVDDARGGDPRRGGARLHAVRPELERGQEGRQRSSASWRWMWACRDASRRHAEEAAARRPRTLEEADLLRRTASSWSPRRADPAEDSVDVVAAVAADHQR